MPRNCRSALLLVLSLWFVLALNNCGPITGASQVVSAQVSRMTEPNLTTATVLIGKASISLPDPMATPDPWDTTFATNMFPLWLTPTTGATVTLNGTPVPERVNGIYFDLPDSLPFLRPYDLRIVLPTDTTVPITAHAVLPDSFTVTQPANNESLGFDSCASAGPTATVARCSRCNSRPTTPRSRYGFLQSSLDTTVMVPKSAFQDSVFGDYRSGDYHITVWALNGGWKRGIDIIRNAGNVHNAIGLYGCATYARPVRIRVH